MLSKKVMLFGSALISGLLLVWLVAMAFAHDQGVYMSQASRGHSLVATPFFVHVYASKAWALGNDNDPCAGQSRTSTCVPWYTKRWSDGHTSSPIYTSWKRPQPLPPM